MYMLTFFIQVLYATGLIMSCTKETSQLSEFESGHILARFGGGHSVRLQKTLGSFFYS